jgi:6,7-dimethyl-8-ribityllumazine synthase
MSREGRPAGERAHSKGPGRDFSGARDGKGLRIGIIVSRFNENVTSRLLAGARQGLLDHGVAAGHIDVAWVPGAFEIPFTAMRMADTDEYDGLICLGAVIKGETDHYHYVSDNAIRGVASVSVDDDIPIGMGILTTENLDQALARSAPGKENKGYEAAVTVLEMASLAQQFDELGED